MDGAVLDKVKSLIKRLMPDSVCDDCITERLGLSVRQHALRSLVRRVEVDAHELRAHLRSDWLLTELGLATEAEPSPDLIITSPVKLSRSGQALRLVQPDGRKVITRGPEQPLIDLLLKARRWWARLNQGDIDIATLAREEGVNDSWMSRVIRLNFRAPDLVTAILSGQHSTKLNVAALTSGGSIPMRWDDQVKLFN